MHDDPDETPIGNTTNSTNTFDETELERELCAATSQKTWLIKNISSYVPILISLLALFLAVYSALETRLHDRLSAEPFTQFYYRVDPSTKEVGLYYKNTGLGAAIVSSIRAYFDNRRIKSFNEVSDKTLDLYRSITPTWEYDLSLGYDVSVPSNDKIKFFFTKVDNLNGSTDEFGDMLKTRLFIILYSCSMYGDCSYNCTKVGDNECRSEEIRLDPASADIKPSSRR